MQHLLGCSRPFWSPFLVWQRMFLLKRQEKHYFFPSWIIDLQRCYTGSKGYSIHCLFHIKHFNRLIFIMRESRFFQNCKLSFFPNLPLWVNKPNIWGVLNWAVLFGFFYFCNNILIPEKQELSSSAHLLWACWQGEPKKVLCPHAMTPFPV